MKNADGTPFDDATELDRAEYRNPIDADHNAAMRGLPESLGPATEADAADPFNEDLDDGETPLFAVDVAIDLDGPNGNAFAIIGLVSRALREVGVTPATVDEYRREAMSGDYVHLLAVTRRWVYLDV